MQANSIAAWQRRLKAYSKAQGISRVQLAAMLGLKPRALQRRFAGQTEWSLSEYLNAIHLVGLPPIPEPNTLRLRYQNRPGAARFDESAYLNNLEVAAEPLFQHPGTIEVASTDLPMFYLLGSPATLRAKFMVFAGGQQLKHPFTSSFLARCERLANHYNTVPRKEIWGKDPLLSLSHQVQYLVQLGLLKLQEVREIKQELIDLLNSLETQLLDKTLSLQLRHDDLRVTNTMYRVLPQESPGITYMSYDNPNAFATADIESNQWFEEHFNQLWERTTALDSSAPIRSYFTFTQHELKRRMQRTEGMLEASED